MSCALISEYSLEYFLPKSGGKIRILSLGRKKQYSYKKSVFPWSLCPNTQRYFGRTVWNYSVNTSTITVKLHHWTKTHLARKTGYVSVNDFFNENFAHNSNSSRLLQQSSLVNIQSHSHLLDTVSDFSGGKYQKILE